MKKTGGKGINTKVLIAVAVAAVVAIAGYFLFRGDSSKEAVNDALAYVEAVQRGDFDAIFKYNATAQKRNAIIANMAEGDIEKEQKALYEELKASFIDAQPTTDLRAQWAEKTVFTRGASVKVEKVDLVLDTENPSQPASERINARVIITVEYPDQATAPDLNGKVKSARYQILMVHGRNVSRVLRKDLKIKRWLFMSLAVDRDSIKYF